MPNVDVGPGSSYLVHTPVFDGPFDLLLHLITKEQVDLYECLKITDAGLPFLARLPRLREAHLDGLPGVTLEGTKVFRPGVRVYYST